MALSGRLNQFAEDSRDIRASCDDFDDHDFGDDDTDLGSCDNCGCDLTDESETLEMLCGQCEWWQEQNNSDEEPEEEEGKDDE